MSLQIKNRTAIKWLHELGFRSQSHKKGIYIDGHEHNNVVEYRSLYLRKLDILEKTHLPPPSCLGGTMQFTGRAPPPSPASIASYSSDLDLSVRYFQTSRTPGFSCSHVRMYVCVP